MTHPKLVESMLKPVFYPHNPDSVTPIQTHISYIFITGDLVYKVKKPVDFGFLDFTTLEKRKYYCDEELRLNQRLAGDVYLGVVPIYEDSQGTLSLREGRSIVEYAVKMKRIPEEKMLYRLLRDGTCDIGLMEKIAETVYTFHANAATGGDIDATGGFETIYRNHEENFEQTIAYIDLSIPRDTHRFIESYAMNFLDTNRPLFEKRVQNHRIRDCHGDLHLEHICVTDEIIIFDCIEFNRRFRYLDVAAEVAFLAMDLDYNGYDDYGRAFIASYIRHSGDKEILKLLNFYRCYFAYVRGKVISFKINDDAVSEEDRKEAAQTASRYFNLSCGYAAEPERPTLVIMSGLMGTGKSVLAGNVAPLLKARVIRSDVLRKELLDLPPGERHFDDFGTGIYSEAMTQKTYDAALQEAEEYLREGVSVIIDASFKKKEERERARDCAARAGADFFIVECTCPDETIRSRLERRLLDRDEASDGRWEIFQSQKRDFDRIDEFPDPVHIVIDTSRPRESATSKTIRKIRLGT